jgi:hypothetical protein
VEIVTESEVAEVLSAGQLELEDDDQAAAAERRRGARRLETETGEIREAQNRHGVRQGSDFPRVLLEHVRCEPHHPDRYQVARRG